MGQHTWFYNDKNLYKESQLLWEKLDNPNLYLDDLEILQIENRLDEIDRLNKTDYHNCFRTSKRESSNGQYTLDVIYSRQECKKWLKDNYDTIRNLNQECLDRFWNDFPNGVIDFG